MRKARIAKAVAGKQGKCERKGRDRQRERETVRREREETEERQGKKSQG